MSTSDIRHVTIRQATLADAGAINDIYNYYVRTSTATWQTEEEPLDARIAWLAGRSPREIVTVAEAEGGILGWALLRPYKPRSGYRLTAEESIYLHHDAQGRGLGTLLLRDLFRRGRQARYQTVIAGVSAEQAPSLGLHKKLGFVQVGYLHGIGTKFDQTLDSVLLQLLPQDMARFDTAE